MRKKKTSRFHRDTKKIKFDLQSKNINQPPRCKHSVRLSAAAPAGEKARESQPCLRASRVADASESVNVLSGNRLSTTQAAAGRAATRESAARVQGTAPSQAAASPAPGTAPGHRLATRARRPRPVPCPSAPPPRHPAAPRLRPAGSSPRPIAAVGARARTHPAASHTRRPRTYSHRRVGSPSRYHSRCPRPPARTR